MQSSCNRFPQPDGHSRESGERGSQQMAQLGLTSLACDSRAESVTPLMTASCTAWSAPHTRSNSSCSEAWKYSPG